MRSICIVSLLRIIWVHRVKAEDVTYGWAPLYLFTALEPLLGIVLACLPLVQPVTSKIFMSSIVDWSRRKLRSTWSSLRSTQNGWPRSSSKSADQEDLRLTPRVYGKV